MAITYKTNRDVRNAKLFGCRAKDLQNGAGIPAGKIVKCKHGFNLVEHYVPNVAGTLVSFCPNGQCVWGGFKLPCMYLPGSPKGKALKGMNYIVAELQNDAAIQYAKDHLFGVVQDENGRNLVNLEIDEFSGQTKERRAMLL